MHTWLEWYLPSDDVEQFRTERARGSLNLCRCRDPSLAAPALKHDSMTDSAVDDVVHATGGKPFAKAKEGSL